MNNYFSFYFYFCFRNYFTYIYGMAKQVKKILSRSVQARAERYKTYRNDITELENAGTTRTEAINEVVRKYKTSTATVYKALNNIL